MVVQDDAVKKQSAKNVQPAAVKKARNVILFSVYVILIGALAGAITWFFFFLMGFGIDFLWKQVPEFLSEQGLPALLYPLFFCLIGDVCVGLYQKHVGPYPEDLNDVAHTVKTKGEYPSNLIVPSFFGALLALVFGASVGPEAGLTGMIAGICSWVGKKLHYAGERLHEFSSMGTAAVIAAIYGAPLFGFATPLLGYADNSEGLPEKPQKIDFPKSTRIITYFLAIGAALATIIGLGNVFGGGLAMPRFQDFSFGANELIWALPIVLLAAGAGFLFHGCGALVSCIDKKLGKKAFISKALIAGAILGAIGTFFPYTMFAGEDQAQELAQSWQQMACVVLFVTCYLKVFVTQVCLGLGWRGGHFFPLIFAGISLGYGVALISGINACFALCVACGALLGAMMKKPLLTACLLMLCFPAESIFVLLIAAALGALVPIPQAWRTHKGA